MPEIGESVVMTWKCGVCKTHYDYKNLAELCEQQNNPEPEFKVGERVFANTPFAQEDDNCNIIEINGEKYQEATIKSVTYTNNVIRGYGISPDHLGWILMNLSFNENEQERDGRILDCVARKHKDMKHICFYNLETDLYIDSRGNTRRGFIELDLIRKARAEEHPAIPAEGE